MPIDFNKLKSGSKRSRPTDPRQIFASRPSGDDAVPDLWKGQGDALDEWYSKNAEQRKNTLIKLNTGGGKTIIGLLIAQSLLNQGKENVVYVCATIDLVRQTEKEAKRLGLNPTTRTGGAFNNDLFELGRSFCITTYQALFNARSVFRGERAPSAIIFDDAHVGEGILRDTFTLRVVAAANPKLHQSLIDFLEPGLDGVGQGDRLKQAVGATPTAPPVLAPPEFIASNHIRFQQILDAYKPADDADFDFPYRALSGNFARCAVTVHGDAVEISPPFIPSKVVNGLDDNRTERVYLSATISSESDFARSFGRKPSLTIQPDDDAGNGERLIIFGNKVDEENTKSAVSDLMKQGNAVLIAVPTKGRAKRWSEYATVSERSNFSSDLDAFRQGKLRAFILAGRFDGIDLPGAQCRLMVVDGLPSQSGLIERYQFESIGMIKSFKGRVATRLTQLFGRINRGKKDFGVFFVVDRQTAIWMKNVSNSALFPPVLRRQILLSEELEDEIGSEASDIINITQQVLDRDKGWQEFYAESLANTEFDKAEESKAKEEDAIYLKAALAEANFMTAVWRGDLDTALVAFDEVREELTRIDPNLAGWHLMWQGVAHAWAAKNDAARRFYREARSRLGSKLPVPRNAREFETTPGESSSGIRLGLRRYAGFEILELERALQRDEKAIVTSMHPDRSSNQHEEAVRQLGEALGFLATRPDNELGIGPDVLWANEDKKVAVAFELKTKKDGGGGDGSIITKDDVGQGANHMNWFRKSHNDYKLLKLFFVADADGYSDSASPDEGMEIVSLEGVAKAWTTYKSSIEGSKAETPLERILMLEQSFAENGIQVGSIDLYATMS